MLDEHVHEGQVEEWVNDIIITIALQQRIQVPVKIWKYAQFDLMLFGMKCATSIILLLSWLLEMSGKKLAECFSIGEC